MNELSEDELSTVSANELSEDAFLVIHSYCTPLDHCSVAQVSRWWRASLGTQTT
jgi:hypothetical protein